MVLSELLVKHKCNTPFLEKENHVMDFGLHKNKDIYTDLGDLYYSPISGTGKLDKFGKERFCFRKRLKSLGNLKRGIQKLEYLSLESPGLGGKTKIDCILRNKKTSFISHILKM